MDEHHSWYNGSVWHKDWPRQVCVGQWPIFYGPVILLHILKTIWCRCCTWDNGSVWLKDRPCKIYVGQWLISWSTDFAFKYIIVIFLSFFIHEDMVPAGGIHAPPGTCSSFFICFIKISFDPNWGFPYMFYTFKLLLQLKTGIEAYMSLVTRKPVFGVCDQGRLKPACSGTETS